jgi:hypothetical protein
LSGGPAASCSASTHFCFIFQSQYLRHGRGRTANTTTATTTTTAAAAATTTNGFVAPKRTFRPQAAPLESEPLGGDGGGPKGRAMIGRRQVTSCLFARFPFKRLGANSTGAAGPPVPTRVTSLDWRGSGGRRPDQDGGYRACSGRGAGRSLAGWPGEGSGRLGGSGWPPPMIVERVVVVIVVRCVSHASAVRTQAHIHTRWIVRSAIDGHTTWPAGRHQTTTTTTTTGGPARHTKSQ